MKKFKIALLGFGNVGQGVWKILQNNKSEIYDKCGHEIEIVKVLVRNPQKERAVAIPQNLLTTNISDIYNDEEICIVVELIGGHEPAKEYMLQAMRRKKHVVTANKLVLALNGEELFAAAQKEGVQLYYEASVGGGIPIIRELNESLSANKIEQIMGIVNGTTNYVLTKMTQEGMDFAEALKEAQLKGYAEADPTADIEGYDAVYKLAIMSSLAFNSKIDPANIYREGISNVKAQDISYAKQFGYHIKLLAVAKEENNKLELRVHPAMIAQNHPIANVNDAFNAIYIHGNAVGNLLLYGRGAGDLPTGSAVLGDIIAILRNNINNANAPQIQKHMAEKTVRRQCENTSKYFIRLMVKDRPGLIGDVSSVFEKHNVTIHNIYKDKQKENAPSVMFFTGKALNGNINHSLQCIRNIDHVLNVENVIRIEDVP